MIISIFYIVLIFNVVKKKLNNFLKDLIKKKKEKLIMIFLSKNWVLKYRILIIIMLYIIIYYEYFLFSKKPGKLKIKKVVGSNPLTAIYTYYVSL